ncbi:RHS repeat-associated core domain-containing protein [Actinoplanes sp. NPDC023801]|uniref:RHS repeat-associated core domain-containing protein n=1 Tax=Actinoplanes sp. NPDC023801 TaxID=3154595 RepID=UPI0033F8DA94
MTGTDYNALGQLDQVKLYTGTGAGGRVYTKYTRDPATGRVTNVRTDRDSVAPYILSDTNYEYDHAGNILRISDAAPEGVDDTQCFTYDRLARMTQAWTPTSGDCAAAPSSTGLGGPAPYWYSWTFDILGNRKTETLHTASNTSTTGYEYPASGAASVRPHAVTATTGARPGSYTYDATGNTLTRPTPSAGTQTLTWDPEGHVDTATDNTGTTTYIYDGDGNRLIQRDPGGRTLYLPGQEIRYTNSTATTGATRYYSHTNGTIGSRTNAGLTWLSADHQGIANIAVNAATQQVTTRRQTPYGTPRGATIEAWPNTRGYVGGTNDNAGLTHLGAREYDPVNGRFISVDPLQNLADPQQWNGYSYANNSPITLSDPDGLEPRPWHDPNYNTTKACDGEFKNSQECNPAGKEKFKIGLGGHPQNSSDRDKDYDGQISRAEADKNIDMDQLVLEEYQAYCYQFGPNGCRGFRPATDEELANAADILFSASDGTACIEDGSPAGCAFFFGQFVGVGKIAGWGKKAWNAVRASKKGDAAKHADDAAEVAESCFKKSFSEDTEVLLADGGSKKFKDLREGDRVLAEDPQTGERGARAIKTIWVHDDDLYVVTIAGQRLVTTEDHPFWNETDKQWQGAEQLDAGDLVRTLCGGGLLAAIANDLVFDQPGPEGGIEDRQV